MLLRSYIPALSIVHRAVALSCKNDARLDTHGLRSAREYISQIEVLALSGQENNNNDTITTLNQANSNATNVTAELHPRTRRVAELEARGVEFSTYLSWEDPEGCPPPLLQCTDCGGRMLSRHRDMVVPTTRCVGLIDDGMKWKECLCWDDLFPEFNANPNLPQPDPNESDI